MGLTRVVAPPVMPLDYAHAADHLRVTTLDDNAVIDALIATATAHLDGRDGLLGRALITQTWDYTLDEFPACDEIILPLPPLQSVTSLSYVDANGATQVWPSSNYLVQTDTTPGRLYLAWGVSWPQARKVRNAVTIRFVAGYGAAGASIPAAIRHAMLLMIGHLYENREASVAAPLQTLPMGVEHLLANYRIMNF